MKYILLIGILIQSSAASSSMTELIELRAGLDGFIAETQSVIDSLYKKLEYLDAERAALEDELCDAPVAELPEHEIDRLDAVWNEGTFAGLREALHRSDRALACSYVDFALKRTNSGIFETRHEQDGKIKVIEFAHHLFLEISQALGDDSGSEAELFLAKYAGFALEWCRSIASEYNSKEELGVVSELMVQGMQMGVSSSASNDNQEAPRRSRKHRPYLVFDVSEVIGAQIKGLINDINSHPGVLSRARDQQQALLNLFPETSNCGRQIRESIVREFEKAKSLDKKREIITVLIPADRCALGEYILKKTQHDIDQSEEVNARNIQLLNFLQPVFDAITADQSAYEVFLDGEHGDWFEAQLRISGMRKRLSLIDNQLNHHPIRRFLSAPKTEDSDVSDRISQLISEMDKNIYEGRDERFDLYTLLTKWVNELSPGACRSVVLELRRWVLDRTEMVRTERNESNQNLLGPPQVGEFVYTFADENTEGSSYQLRAHAGEVLAGLRDYKTYSEEGFKRLGQKLELISGKRNTLFAILDNLIDCKQFTSIPNVRKSVADMFEHIGLDHSQQGFIRSLPPREGCAVTQFLRIRADHLLRHLREREDRMKRLFALFDLYLGQIEHCLADPTGELLVNFFSHAPENARTWMDSIVNRYRVFQRTKRAFNAVAFAGVPVAIPEDQLIQFLLTGVPEIDMNSFGVLHYDIIKKVRAIETKRQEQTDSVMIGEPAFGDFAYPFASETDEELLQQARSFVDNLKSYGAYQRTRLSTKRERLAGLPDVSNVIEETVPERRSFGITESYSKNLQSRHITTFAHLPEQLYESLREYDSKHWYDTHRSLSAAIKRSEDLIALMQPLISELSTALNSGGTAVEAFFSTHSGPVLEWIKETNEYRPKSIRMTRLFELFSKTVRYQLPAESDQKDEIEDNLLLLKEALTGHVMEGLPIPNFESFGLDQESVPRVIMILKEIHERLVGAQHKADDAVLGYSLSNPIYEFMPEPSEAVQSTVASYLGKCVADMARTEAEVAVAEDSQKSFREQLKDLSLNCDRVDMPLTKSVATKIDSIALDAEIAEFIKTLPEPTACAAINYITAKQDHMLRSQRRILEGLKKTVKFLNRVVVNLEVSGLIPSVDFTGPLADMMFKLERVNLVEKEVRKAQGSVPVDPSSIESFLESAREFIERGTSTALERIWFGSRDAQTRKAVLDLIKDSTDSISEELNSLKHSKENGEFTYDYAPEEFRVFWDSIPVGVAELDSMLLGFEARVIRVDEEVQEKKEKIETLKARVATLKRLINSRRTATSNRMGRDTLNEETNRLHDALSQVPIRMEVVKNVFKEVHTHSATTLMTRYERSIRECRTSMQTKVKTVEEAREVSATLREALGDENSKKQFYDSLDQETLVWYRAVAAYEILRDRHHKIRLALVEFYDKNQCIAFAKTSDSPEEKTVIEERFKEIWPSLEEELRSESGLEELKNAVQSMFTDSPDRIACRVTGKLIQTMYKIRDLFHNRYIERDQH